MQLFLLRLLHLHPGGSVKTDIINPQIDFDAVQTEFRKKRFAPCPSVTCGVRYVK